jgi:D-threo-aldose 1-dehydrogenase
VLAAGAFNGGLIAGSSALFNYRPAPPEIMARLAELQREHGANLRAAALRFVLGHPAVTSLVAGAMRASEVRENAQAVRP